MTRYQVDAISAAREADIRAEIRRLEIAYQEHAASGVKIGALAAISALRWILGDVDRTPADVLEGK